MPKIAAYHPVIRVQNGSRSAFIELDLDDWYPETGVKSALKESTGARTAGEAVEVVESGILRPQRSKCLDARILGSGDAEPTVTIDWDEAIA